MDPASFSAVNKLVVLKATDGREIQREYQIGDEVGRGGFGVTYSCIERCSGNVYACKSIPKKKLKTAKYIECVRREVEVMKKYLPGHVNIVNIRHTFEDNDGVHLVMNELCGGRSLFDRPHLLLRAITLSKLRLIMKTIAKVVKSCHENGVMHRDLKLEHFLYAYKRESAPLKLIDFEPGQKFYDAVGSLYFMAPEVLKRNYGPEVDVWSAGVILYTLLCGVLPFLGETLQEIAQAILGAELDFQRDPWPKVSENAKDLVRKMLDRDPLARLTPQQVVGKHIINDCEQRRKTSVVTKCRSSLKLMQDVSIQAGHEGR
ncbi:hypothetical protein QQ045_003729 [Rhodiola kirilowii]